MRNIFEQLTSPVQWTREVEALALRHPDALYVEMGPGSVLKGLVKKIAPESGDYVHTLEGADDSTSHLRMALTRTSEVVPIAEGRMTLGTWQGIFVFEHRRAPHSRQIDLTVVGT